MPKTPFLFFIIIGAFLTAFGLAISLQEVFGINIGSDLNFALTGKKITGLPVPVASSDAATRGFVDSATAGSGLGGLYGVCGCYNSTFPPFCSSGLCGCPAGYTQVLISDSPLSYGSPAHSFYSCQKTPYGTPYGTPPPYSTPVYPSP